MLRVFFGGLLAVTVFLLALLLEAEWVTADRPTAWLARLAGDQVVEGPDPLRVAHTPPAPPGDRRPEGQREDVVRPSGAPAAERPARAPRMSGDAAAL